MRRFALALVSAALAACAQPEAKPRPSVPWASPRETPGAAGRDRSLAELVKEIEAAYKGGDYGRGLSLVKQALELRRDDISAPDRIGSIYFVLGRYAEALAMWEQALPLEKDAGRRQELALSIARTRHVLGLPPSPTLPPVPPAEPAPPVAAAAAPPATSTAAAAAPPPATPPAKPPPRRPSPEEIESIYQKGLSHYALGELLQASASFMRVLALDPQHLGAHKALERLRGRLGPAKRP